MLILLLKRRIYEFTPMELSKLLKVTNKTVINRCANLAGNGFLQPMLVKERIRSYRLTAFARMNEKVILDSCLDKD